MCYIKVKSVVFKLPALRSSQQMELAGICHSKGFLFNLMRLAASCGGHLVSPKKSEPSKTIKKS